MPMDPSEDQEPQPHFLQWHLPEFNTANIHAHTTKALFLLLVFISITILIAALFLYAHWVRRHRRLSGTSVTAAAVPEAGLDPAVVKSLPMVISFVGICRGDDTEKLSDQCTICLGVFEDEEKLKVLPECKHVYHSDCLDIWLSSHSTCPLCRAFVQLIVSVT